jgi:hypothetical protein
VERGAVVEDLRERMLWVAISALKLAAFVYDLYWTKKQRSGSEIVRCLDKDRCSIQVWLRYHMRRLILQRLL